CEQKSQGARNPSREENTFRTCSFLILLFPGSKKHQPGSILPWRQVSRAGRLTGAASDRVGPFNQTALVRARRANKSNGAIVCRNIKRHGRTQDEAGCGVRSWCQLS